jgi:hypothetical protein
MLSVIIIAINTALVRVIMLGGIMLIGDILIVILPSGVLPNVFMSSFAMLWAVLAY